MRGIAKVINGEIQVFATEGEANEGAPVYVFDTKEEYDAAIENNLIPIGAIIIKTYDGVEMAGGPFDSELSQESENAVQNLAVTAAINRIQELLDEVKNLKATLETFGMGKTCPVDVTDVTEANGMVCGAWEKNPAVVGSLANMIANAKEKFVIKNIVSETQIAVGTSIEIPENDCSLLLLDGKQGTLQHSFIIIPAKTWIQTNILIYAGSSYNANLLIRLLTNTLLIQAIETKGWGENEFSISVYGIL